MARTAQGQSNIVLLPSAKKRPISTASLNDSQASLICQIEGMLRRAKSGELRGLCALETSSKDKNQISVCGSLAGRLSNLAFLLIGALEACILRMRDEGV